MSHSAVYMRIGFWTEKKYSAKKIAPVLTVLVGLFSSSFTETRIGLYWAWFIRLDVNIITTEEGKYMNMYKRTKQMCHLENPPN
jgi:hypothetical protein